MYLTIQLNDTDLEQTNTELETITTELEQTLETLNIDTHRIKKLGTTRSDWEKGDSCPICNSRRIHALYIGSRELHSENNTLTYSGETPWSESNIRYQCHNCWETLYATPPGDLVE